MSTLAEQCLAVAEKLLQEGKDAHQAEKEREAEYERRAKKASKP